MGEHPNGMLLICQVSSRIEFPKSCPLLVSLVILTSRFEAARGLFWDGPRNFETRSDDDEDTSAGTPSWDGSLPAGPLPALHPSWVGRASVSIFAPHQREYVWPPT
ncbi:hypothetical protein AVEN_64312-1 [Araneus ventricosus]|uniref:Uncharacterized protein n=1 Tax=Araneus ventricosus TaxID=182803 RepID=A0A4Y2PI11_ARAVE|nr:hypothetical protein AVEN_64312-1 [Araneus ventricosus]